MKTASGKMRHLCILHSVLIITVLALAQVVSARPDYEREVMAYKGWKVRGIEIEGLGRSASSSLSKGLFLATRPALYSEALEEDLARIRLFMARRGYPYSSTTPTFSPNEGWKDVKVTFNVDPGPAVIVSEVNLNGVPDGLDAPARRLVLTREGSVFEDDRVIGTVESLDSLFLYWGYARVKVESEVAGLDTTSVSVSYEANAGRVNYFRSVAVEGAPEDLVSLTEKVSDISQGERYSTKVMRDARDNLRRLDIYRRVTLETEEVGEDSLDLKLNVATRDPRTVKASLRYWNDEGLRFGVNWRHRNLFGAGRGFYTAGILSRLRQRAEVSLWWPALVAPRSREALSVIFERENEEAYEQLGYGVDISTTYFFTIENNIQVSLLVADVAVTYKTADSADLDVPKGILTALTARANQNSTDDPFNPRRGFSSWTAVTWTPERLSDNAFIKWEGSASTYFGQLDPAVFAVKLGLGLGTATGDTPAIIASERFYSGGANSMRGFGRRKLGPKDSAGGPIGGEAKFEASLELRGPLFWRLWGAAFIDAGQVWLKSNDIDLGKIEVAVGPGIWLMTPVGPMRFDVGYRLTMHDEVEPRVAYHFAVGTAF